MIFSIDAERLLTKFNSHMIKALQKVVIEGIERKGKKNKSENIKIKCRASLVAQWLRACLSMQGTRVRALVWEDPTCRGATKPVSHNY